MKKVRGFCTIGEILESLYGCKPATETENETVDHETRIWETVGRIEDLLDGTGRK